MNFQKQMADGLLWAKLPMFIRKVESAQKNIETMYALCAKPYVSVSWGKDSTVLAHLVLRVHPDAVLVHWGGPQETHISNFSAVRDDFLSRFGGRYRDISDDGLMHGKLRNAGRTWSIENGFDGVFIGLTKEESRARRITLSKANPANNIFTYTGGLRRCCPLADWTVEDICAYVAANNLKMLALYERFGMHIRTSSRIKQTGHTRAGLEYLNSTAQTEVKEYWNEI